MHRTGRIAVATFVSLACVGLAVEAEAVPTGIGTCRTINQPGSYVLRRNLTSAGTCLVVNADFVTIDLNGFVIAGDGTGVGVTDNSVTRRGTVIHGGSITNFAVGILMDISNGGLCFKTNDRLQKKTVIKISVPINQVSPSIPTFGQVVWVSRNWKRKEYWVGVRFIL